MTGSFGEHSYSGQISYVVERYEEDSGLRGSGDPEAGPHGCNGLIRIYSHDTRNHGIDWRGFVMPQ
jgi:hypothetical protein